MAIKHEHTAVPDEVIQSAFWNADHTGTATPTNHGNEAHTSVFITGPEVPANETDPVYTAWDKDHADLSNVTTDQHHARYTDNEAVAAVAAADVYLLNTGDTATGDYLFSDGIKVSDTKEVNFGHPNSAIYCDSVNFTPGYYMFKGIDNAAGITSEATFSVYGNAAADGSGSWEPEILLANSGLVVIRNTTQGDAGARILQINMTSGVDIQQGGLNVTGNIGVTGTVDGIDIATDVGANTAARHARQHSITSTSDHTSTATSGRILQADANGLPVNATNTDAEVADAVTKKHTQNTDISLKSNVTTGVMQIVGPAAGTTRVKTIRDANDTIVELGGGGTFTAAVVAADHGAAATDQVINVCYGTGDPPAANTTTEGAIFIKYTA